MVYLDKKKVSEYEVKIRVKYRTLFNLKMRMITFFDYFMDTSQWKMNFIKDLQDYPSRYFKTYVEPPEMIEEGGDPNL